MDPVLISAYTEMLNRHRVTVDDILCHPDYRCEFLSVSRQSLGAEASEYEILHRLSNLRKKSKLPRTRDTIAA